MAYDGYRNQQQQQQHQQYQQYQQQQPSYNPPGLNNGYPEALNPQTSPYQQPPPPPPPSYPNQYIPEPDRTRPQPPPPPPPPPQQPQQPQQQQQQQPHTQQPHLPTSPGLNSPVIPPQYTDASRRQYPPQAPVNDASNPAVNNAGASASLSPDLISQITATVIQQLKATGLAPNQGQQPVQPLDLSAGGQPMEPSRSNHSDYPPSSGNRTVYTPPSPHRTGDESAYRETQVPPATATQTEYPSYNASPGTERRPFSPPNQPVDHVHKEARPKYASELSNPGQETTLEKIWGQLFDKDGHPTARLGQLLRGVAVHLIEDYAPGNTIIITPEKLQKFYEDTRVPGDTYPWQDIFDDGTSSISRLFREVEAEHHLVQEKLDERPDTPGLTARGFERWATLMIQAHPQQEYERLHKAVLSMPINNPDNRKERFPKEIPRRLFPIAANQTVKDILEQGFATHCKIDLSNAETPQPPKQTHPRYRSDSSVDNKPPTFSKVDRDKQPYCSSVVDEEDEERPSPPPNQTVELERERKPYSAQPGRGKKFGEEKRSSPTHAEASASAGKPPPPPAEPAQESTYLHPRGAPRKGSPTVATRSGRHNRSPSVGVSDYRRSEGDLPRKHRSSFNSAHGASSGGAYAASGDLDDIRRYRDTRGKDGARDYDHPLDDRDRDGSRYRDAVPRSAGGNGWTNDEDYYRLGPGGGGSSDRGLLGGRMGNAGVGYDYEDPPSYPGGYR